MKKFYLLTIIALLGISQVWANTAKKEEGTWEGNRDWSGPHAAFHIEGENSKDGSHLDVAKNADQIISWQVEEGCTINVTALKFRVGYSMIVHGGTGCEIYVNDTKKEKIYTTGGSDKEYGGYNLGNDETFKLKFSTKVDLYWVEIVYTISPNDKPSVVITESQVIDVTVNPENKQTIDLSQLFAMPENAAEDFEFGYELSGGAVDGNNFYATAAGTYTAKARIAAKADHHEASDLSEGEATIIVNRLDQTLSWVDEEAIETNIVIEDTKNIAAVSTSGRAVSYISSDESVLSVDEAGKLTALKVGEATVIVSCDQDDQYNAAAPIQKTFLVIRKTPEFLPVDFVTEDSCVIRKNETATIELNLVSDGLDGDFTAVASNDKISVSREGNVLTIQALAVGEATLTLTQQQTDLLAEVSKTYKIEVLGLTNTIWVNGVEDFAKDMHFDAHMVVEFTSENTDEEAPEFIVEQISGEDIATYEEGVIIASHHLGTATWKVSQAKSENYEAAQATFSITVKPAEAMTGCNVLEDADERSWSSQGNSGAYVFAIDEPGDILHFDAQRTDICVIWCLGNNTDWHIEYATTLTPGNKDWVDLPNGAIECEEKDQYYYDFQYQLPEDARAIRFITANAGSFGNKFIKNVSVTRKTWVKAEDVVLNLLPEQDGEGVLTVDYSLADGNELKIMSDNDLFTLDQNTIAYENCTSGKVEIPVHFAAKADLGTYTTNLTIYNEFYNATVKLVAKVRITPEITWNIAELTYGDHQENAASVSPSLALKYEVIDGDAITLDGDVLVAANAGKATVKAYTEETESYNAAEETLEITVNQLAIEIVDPEETIYLEEGDALTNDLLAELTKALEKLLGWIEGIFTWNTTQTEAVAGDVEYEVTFTPDDTNLAPAPAKVRVNVKGTATGCDNLEAGSKSVKLLINGQVYIYRDGRLYNLQGLRVE